MTHSNDFLQGLTPLTDRAIGFSDGLRRWVQGLSLSRVDYAINGYFLQQVCDPY